MGSPRDRVGRGKPFHIRAPWLPQSTQASGSGTTGDTDLIDLVFSNPGTLQDPLLDQLATALTG